MNNNSMAKKTMLYFAGNFSSKIFGVIIIPIYAKYLTANELGEFDFQQTLANLLMPILGLALWEAVLRFALKAEGEKLKEIITSSTLVLLSTVAVSTFFIVPTYITIYGNNVITILYTFLIISLPLVIFFGYVSRAIQQSTVFAFSGVVSAGVNLLGIGILVVWLGLGLKGLLISAISANVFNILYLIVGSKTYKFINIKYFSKREAKKMVYYSAPLILNLVFGWFLNSFSRFFINLQLGATANGMYAFASKFSGIVLQLSTVINMSVIEDSVESIGHKEWSTRFENNIKQVNSLLIQSSYVILSLTSVYYIFIENKDFQASLYLVPFLLVVSVLTCLSTMVGNPFIVTNYTNKIFITSLIGGVTNILLTIVFSHYFDLLGVVLAQISSLIIIILFRYKMSQQYQKYNLELLNLFIKTGMFLLFSAVILISTLKVRVFLSIICLLIIIIINRYFLKNIMKYITNKLG